MEFKKKTIIWEDNNEPPKNYIWVKSDGNAYEFNHTTRQWEKIMSSNGSDSGSGSDEIDYEAIYQFQIKKLKDEVHPFVLSDAIIPEHYSDVTDCVGTEYSTGTLGVFKANKTFIDSLELEPLGGIVDGILFIDWTNGDAIFFGEYSNTEGSGEDPGHVS